MGSGGSCLRYKAAVLWSQPLSSIFALDVHRDTITFTESFLVVPEEKRPLVAGVMILKWFIKEWDWWDCIYVAEYVGTSGGLLWTQ